MKRFFYDILLPSLLPFSHRSASGRQQLKGSRWVFGLHLSLPLLARELRRYPEKKNCKKHPENQELNAYLQSNGDVTLSGSIVALTIDEAFLCARPSSRDWGDRIEGSMRDGWGCRMWMKSCCCLHTCTALLLLGCSLLMIDNLQISTCITSAHNQIELFQIVIYRP